MRGTGALGPATCRRVAVFFSACGAPERIGCNPCSLAIVWCDVTGVAGRLVNQHGAIPAGSLGIILGWFVDTGTYVVDFADGGPRLAEVRLTRLR